MVLMIMRVKRRTTLKHVKRGGGRRLEEEDGDEGDDDALIAPYSFVFLLLPSPLAAEAAMGCRSLLLPLSMAVLI